MSNHKKPSRAQGVTLIELAVILVFITIAIAPLVNMIGGPRSHDGNLSRTTGHQTKQVVFANSMIERALSGDMIAIQCEGGMGGLPLEGATDSCQGTYEEYSKPIYYQWVVRNLSDTLPDGMGNELYDATLNVFKNADYETSIGTYPVKVFNNIGPDEVEPDKTGIVISLDLSGSMGLNAGFSAMTGPTDGSAVNAPWMYYRYSDPAYPAYTPPGSALNLFDDAQLDITAWGTDDPATLWREDYGKPGVLGLPNDCLTYKDSNFFDRHGTPTFNADGWKTPAEVSVQQSWMLFTLCGNAHTVEYKYEHKVSRIEAARSSLLSFLLSIESDSEFYNNIRLGLTGFDGDYEPDLFIPNNVNGDLEEADVSGKYGQMRRTLSWINRAGPGRISPKGSTEMWNNLYDSARILYNNMDDNNITNGIIFVLSDGAISSGRCAILVSGYRGGNGGHPNGVPSATPTGQCFKNTAFSGDRPTTDGLANSFANGTFPGADGRTIKVYSLALLEHEDITRPIFQDGLTGPTGGVYKNSPTLGNMDEVFEDLKYAILKEVLISKVNRYGIDMD